MTEHSDRAQELIAAALAGDLSPAEQQEFEALRAQDPSIDSTMAEFSSLVTGLRTAGHQWEEATPPPSLEQSVLSLAGDLSSDDGTPAEQPGGPVPDHETSSADASLHPALDEQSARSTSTRSRRRAAFALAAAGGAVLGGAVTVGVQQIMDTPPDGPPGTYGAVEDVAFDSQTPGVDLDASLIAHTWGTETVLEIDGLEPGESFTVVLISEAGEEYASGTFFGSEVLIECRMNAAVMRDEVARVEITAADGDLIAGADLPDAIDPEAEETETEAADAD